jgi:hypothetical protein
LENYALLFLVELYLKAIATPQPQNRQHLLFNRIMPTLYFNVHRVLFEFYPKDNKLSEAETIRNQFGRLKAP